ncbi:MAG TPA: M23 family metallopeptidase [Anaerolineales bacterium]|nr:M23 family metallopeptidase [Anaerolineales bacterium]
MILLPLAILAARALMAAFPTQAEASRPSQEPVGIGDEAAQSLTMEDLPDFAAVSDSAGGIPRQASPLTIIPTRPRPEVVRYVVQSGDTLFGIADRFGLRPETLLWGNYEVLQDNPHSLRPGQELSILPVDGALYRWNTGDTLGAVANLFRVSVEDILDWPGNGLSHGIDAADPPIQPGTQLVIPGGQREFVTWRAPRITRANPAVARLAGPGACGSVYDGPIGEGFFIWPTTGRSLSGFDYSSYHPGIDIQGSEGNSIFASASGVIVYAGWSDYGYGLMAVIDHGDGWQTLYAHMSQVNVVCGQATFQGNVIGLVGSTGNSTGPHLHFEIESDLYGKVNPWDYVSP